MTPALAVGTILTEIPPCLIFMNASEGTAFSYLPDRRKIDARHFIIFPKENGRGGEIRTHDLLYPKQARYQPTLRPDTGGKILPAEIPDGNNLIGEFWLILPQFKAAGSVTKFNIKTAQPAPDHTASFNQNNYR